SFFFFFFFQAEDGIRDFHVTGVQTCALPISALAGRTAAGGLSRPDVPAPGKKRPGEKGDASVPALRRRRSGCIGLARRRPGIGRSEERRVGKECRSRWWPEH